MRLLLDHLPYPRMLFTEGTAVPAPTPLSQLPMGHTGGPRGLSFPALEPQIAEAAACVTFSIPRAGGRARPVPRSPRVPVPRPREAPAAVAASACGGSRGKWGGSRRNLGGEQEEQGFLYLPAAPQELQSAPGTGAWCSPSPSASWAAPLCSWPRRLGLKVRESGGSVPPGPFLPLPSSSSLLLLSSLILLLLPVGQIRALCWSQVELGMPVPEHH